MSHLGSIVVISSLYHVFSLFDGHQLQALVSALVFKAGLETFVVVDSDQLHPTLACLGNQALLIKP